MAARKRQGNFMRSSIAFDVVYTHTFEGCLIGETTLGKHLAVRPTVKGKANIIGTARWLIDRDDPVGAGFLVR
jgi:proline racemase